MLKVQFISQS